jgi:prolyl 4-hydroxylase
VTNELALAAEYDAAGRHDEAVNALARGTQGGDIAATVALGKRLLVGDRAPCLPKDAVSFLYDALKGGSMDAALRIAPLAAIGAYVPQSWSDALGLLLFAAERGSEDARGQLLALSSTTDPVIAATGWRRVVEQCEPRTWLVAPPGETLNEQPLVRSFAELATESVCDWLRRRAHGRVRRALVYDPAQGGAVPDHMRSNGIVGFDLADLDVVQAALQSRMADACGVPVQNAEGPTILHYAVGEQITNHYDFLNPGIADYQQVIEQRGERIVTFLLYLNDDYDGGETAFPQIGVRHKGRRRAGLFFANALPNGKPDARMVHAGLPPTRGEKWIVSQFFRSRAALNARAEHVG